MKTRKFRKSMLSTVVILMAAILSLTGATYAWFTSGESATVQSITAGVESGSGLLVSSDGATWMDNISINIAEEGFEYKALSSAGIVTNGVMGIFSASLDTSVTPNKITGIAAADQTETADGEASRNGGFVMFDIYFNNANGPAKSININNSVISTGGNTRAFRIAFINQGSLNVTQSGTDYPTTLRALMNGNASVIYEPEATNHITSGIRDYQTNYNPGAISTDKFDYFGIKSAPTSAESIDRYVGKYVPNETDGGYTFQEGTSDNLAKVTTITDKAASFIELGENTYTKVTVVIWLEGQDADCLNEISGGEFTVQLGFNVIDPSTQG